MKQPAKAFIRNALRTIHRNRPIRSWPGVLGRLYGFKVPKNVVPKRTASATGGANINILFELMDRIATIEGDIAECGVFRGATLVPMAVYNEQIKSGKLVFGFDSFEGLDASAEYDVRLGGVQDRAKRVGGFSETSHEAITGKLEAFALTNTVRIVKGYFNETLTRFADRRFSFVHLDCVIHESYKTCLRFFYPRLNPGAIVLLDEYNDPRWPGCNQAVDEFLGSHAERLQEIERDRYQKYYFVKE